MNQPRCYISVALDPVVRPEVEHRMAKVALERHNRPYDELDPRLQESIFHATVREVRKGQ